RHDQMTQGPVVLYRERPDHAASLRAGTDIDALTCGSVPGWSRPRRTNWASTRVVVDGAAPSPTIGSMSTPLSIHLLARLQPLDRGDLYEEPLQEILAAHAPGCAITHGGTMTDAGGEPQSCDIELDIEGDAAIVLGLVIRTLETCGAPRGSKAFLGDAE